MKPPDAAIDVFSDLARRQMPRAPHPTPRILPTSAKTIGGPIPVGWLVAAAKQGKDALLVGLMVWCARNWPKLTGVTGSIALSDDAFGVWGVARPGRALSRLEASGLIKVVGRPEEYVVTVELLVPEATHGQYILGPIDVAWVVRAAALGVTALLVGLALWGFHRRRRKRMACERKAVSNVALVDWGIPRETKLRSLHKLADAGLIEASSNTCTARASRFCRRMPKTKAKTSRKKSVRQCAYFDPGALFIDL